MMILDGTLQKLMQAGADQAACIVHMSEKHELNTETGTIKLLRSNKDVKISMTYIKDRKKGSITINKQDEKSIDEAIDMVIKLSNASNVDEAYDIAPQAEGSFQLGIMEPDLDLVYSSLNEFNQDVKKMYPKILGDAILAYDFDRRFYKNSNGLNLEESKGRYLFEMVFSAKDGEKVTSFNVAGASTLDLKQKLIHLGGMNKLLEQSEKELEARSLSQKFVGDVIITPQCLSDILGMYASICLNDGSLISKSSVLKDKLGEKVASEKMTWLSNPTTVTDGYRVTSEGLIAEDMPIIENGILKNFMLSQYAGKKTGLGHSKNVGGAFIIEAGEQPLEEMIKNVEKGVLFCRISAGNPGPDGVLSGVAKNSFYIENGAVQFPLTETMVTANIFKLFEDIKAISKEKVDFGSNILPYIHTSGVTISSK